MKDQKVVSITSRMERWTTAYELEGLVVSVSNHGRINILLDGKQINLDIVESVDMIGRVSKALEGVPGLT